MVGSLLLSSTRSMTVVGDTRHVVRIDLAACAVALSLDHHPYARRYPPSFLGCCVLSSTSIATLPSSSSSSSLPPFFISRPSCLTLPSVAVPAFSQRSLPPSSFTREPHCCPSSPPFHSPSLLSQLCFPGPHLHPPPTPLTHSPNPLPSAAVSHPPSPPPRASAKPPAQRTPCSRPSRSNSSRRRST